MESYRRHHITMPRLSSFAAEQSGAYPTSKTKAQPWKRWMKLSDPTASGAELVVTMKACENAVGGLGGY